MFRVDKKKKSVVFVVVHKYDSNKNKQFFVIHCLKLHKITVSIMLRRCISLVLGYSPTPPIIELLRFNMCHHCPSPSFTASRTEIPSVYQQGKLAEEQKANQELTKVGRGMKCYSVILGVYTELG